MSVEKLSDLSRSKIEHNPYTQILNDVIENIKDNDAFRIYAFLLSKSRDWKVIKSYAAKVCGTGQDKSKLVFSYLNRCGLIDSIVIKNEQGKIVRHDLIVLNGSKFNKNEYFLNNKVGDEELSTEEKNHRWHKPPAGKTIRVEIPPLLNKDITNKEKDTKKSFCVLREKQKAENKKKYDWSVQKQSGFADTTKQSNSWKPEKISACGRESAIKALAEIKRKLPGSKINPIIDVCQINKHELDSLAYLGAPAHVGTLVNSLINSNCG